MAAAGAAVDSLAAGGRPAAAGGARRGSVAGNRRQSKIPTPNSSGEHRTRVEEPTTTIQSSSMPLQIPTPSLPLVEEDLSIPRPMAIAVLEPSTDMEVITTLDMVEVHQFPPTATEVLAMVHGLEPASLGVWEGTVGQDTPGNRLDSEWELASWEEQLLALPPCLSTIGT